VPDFHPPPRGSRRRGSGLSLLGMAAVVASSTEQAQVAQRIGAAVPYFADVVDRVARLPTQGTAPGIAYDYPASDLLPEARVIALVCWITALGRRSPAQQMMLWRTSWHRHWTMNATCAETALTDLRVIHEVPNTRSAPSSVP
jgi:hypothetical protein